jgi:riboflavin synthase
VIATALAREIGEGDSVAVNGVCLTATAVDRDAGAFAVDVMHETLVRSSLGEAGRGRRWSTSSCRCAPPTGSAATSCRVTSTGSARCATCARTGFARVVTVGAPPPLLRYVVEKGLDRRQRRVAHGGRQWAEDWFSVSLIPRRSSARTSAPPHPGAPVNMEVDIVAKYVEKLVAR